MNADEIERRPTLGLSTPHFWGIRLSVFMDPEFKEMGDLSKLARAQPQGAGQVLLLYSRCWRAGRARPDTELRSRQGRSDPSREGQRKTSACAPANMGPTGEAAAARLATNESGPAANGALFATRGEREKGE